MLAFIDDDLAPAARSFNELLRNVADNTSDRIAATEIKAAIDERNLALQHRRLTWETAEALATSGWPKDATQKWLDSAQAYASVGQRDK